MTRNQEVDDPEWMLEMVSPGRDFLLRRKVKADPWLEVGGIKPAPGDDIEIKTRFPNHKLAGVTPADEGGWQYEYYLAPLSNQQSYNWQFANSLGEEYDEVSLTYIVPRASYTPGAISAPPALGGRTWTYMGERQVRRDARTDALFVETVHLYRDISAPRAGQEIDMETGLVRPYEERIVPAGTAGQAVDTNGTAKQVRHLNALWSLERTLQVAGLAGGGNGATRSWGDVVNYSWPDVLLGFNFYALPAADGSLYKIAQRPIYLREAYSGPCAATITETWTKTPPTPPVITPMLEGEVWFDGALLQVPRTRALHPAMVFYEAPGTGHPELGNYLYYQAFEATSLTDWPATYVASFNVTPAFGGYLSRKLEITRPTTTLFANLLQLTGAPTVGVVNGWTLNWQRLNPVGTLVRYRVDINTKPDFTGSYLSGWKNRNMTTALTAAVTGLVPGVVYYARVKAEITAQPTAVSNTLLAAVEPVVAYTLTVVETSQALSEGSDVDFGTTVTGGSPVVLTIRITNTGNVVLTGLARALSGTHAADWTAAALSSANLAAGATRDFTLSFVPGADGARVAEVALTTTNGPDVVFQLEGTGVTPTLQVENPIGTPLTSGVSSINMLSDGVQPAQTDIRLKSVGTGAVTITAINLIGADAAQWFVQTFLSPPLPIALGTSGQHTVELIYEPPGGWPHTAQLEIVSNDPNSPFVVDLNGDFLS